MGPYLHPGHIHLWVSEPSGATEVSEVETPLALWGEIEGN